jgi:hypothetical protein
MTSCASPNQNVDGAAIWISPPDSGFSFNECDTLAFRGGSGELRDACEDVGQPKALIRPEPAYVSHEKAKTKQ